MVKNLKLDDKGLIPAIIQDEDSGDVLMLGYMNQESLELTLSSGEVWFYSRSRQELWHKGATSGNRLIVSEIWLDCDRDTILVKARPMGPVCHTGERTCFCPDALIETYAEALTALLPGIKITVNESRYDRVYGHVCAEHSVNSFKPRRNRVPAILQETNHKLYLNADLMPDHKALETLRRAFAAALYQMKTKLL